MTLRAWVTTSVAKNWTLISIAGARVATIGAGAVGLFGMAAVMGPTEYGKYAVCLGLATILSQLCKWGLDGVAVRQIARGHSSNPELARNFIRWSAGIVIRRSLAAAALTGIVVALYVVSIGPPPLFISSLPHAAALAIPTSLGLLLQGVLRGLSRQRSAEVFEGSFKPIAILASAVIFAFVTGERVSLTVAVGIAFMVSSAAVALSAHYAVVNAAESSDLKQTDPESLAAWKNEASRHGSMNFFQVVLSRAPILIAGVVFTPAQVALVAIAFRVAELAQFASVTLGLAISPQVSRLHHASLASELRQLLGRTSLFGFLGSLILSCAIVVALPVVPIALGGSYRDVAMLVLILLTFQLASATLGPVGYFASMMGLQGQATIINGVVGALLALTLFGAGRLGSLPAFVSSVGLAALVVATWLRIQLSLEMGRLPEPRSASTQ